MAVLRLHREEERVAGLTDEEKTAEAEAAKEADDAATARLAAEAEAEEDRKFQERAERLGYKPPEPPAPKPADGEPAAEDEEQPDFMEKAMEEATAQGKDYAWAQSRAMVLANEWTAEQQVFKNFTTQADAVIPRFAAEFEATGVDKEVAPVIATDYHAILKTLGKSALRDDDVGKSLQWLAVQAAKGNQYDRDLAEAGTGGTPRQEPPAGGGGGGDRAKIIGQIDDAGKKFIANMEKVHNDGKPATTEQLKAWKEQGAI